MLRSNLMIVGLALALAGCSPTALINGVLNQAAQNAIGTGGGSASVKFSAATGTNANSSDLSGSTIVTGALNDNNLVLSATSLDVMTSKGRTLVVTLAGASKPTAGTTFNVLSPTSANSSASKGTAAQVLYSESTGSAAGASGTPASWAGSGGTVTLDTVNGKSVTATLHGVTMAMVPGTTSSSNSATGTFTLDGSITSSNTNGL